MRRKDAHADGKGETDLPQMLVEVILTTTSSGSAGSSPALSWVPGRHVSLKRGGFSHKHEIGRLGTDEMQPQAACCTNMSGVQTDTGPPVTRGTGRLVLTRTSLAPYHSTAIICRPAAGMSAGARAVSVWGCRQDNAARTGAAGCQARMLSMPAGSDSCNRTLQVAWAARKAMLTRRLKGPLSAGPAAACSCKSRQKTQGPDLQVGVMLGGIQWPALPLCLGHDCWLLLLCSAWKMVCRAGRLLSTLGPVRLWRL